MQNDNHLKPSRLHIILTGRVQNIGFRSFVQRVAVSSSLTGWVRNMRYDQVEIVAEGTRPSLESFLHIVKVGPLGSRVDDLDISWGNCTGEFSGFNIRSSH